MNRCQHQHGERSRPHQPDANDALAGTLSKGGLELARHNAVPGSAWAIALARELARRDLAEQPKPYATN
jgi:hypothetical protein